MQPKDRFRIPALFCALAVLVCELISRPFANMGICDDGPYILMARNVASTGHIRYVGAAATMLGSQLYIGAAMIRLFGFSLSTVRMGTLIFAMATAFLIERVMVHCGISERNATIGTLALVVSPLYLMLSVTFMSDIYGLFGVVACLYCCVRAIHTVTPPRAIAWICAAVIADAFFGTARQIAWLGILVMVPSTLWLLRDRRRTLLGGAVITLAGALFIFGSMKWFHQQPYSLPVPGGSGRPPLGHTAGELLHAFLDIPFLLLPLFVIFIPQIYKSRPRVIAALSTISLGYILLAVRWRESHPDLLLEPTQGVWVTPSGGFQGLTNGLPPVFLHPATQVLLTVFCVGGLLGLLASFFRIHRKPQGEQSAPELSWKQLAILLAPFTMMYVLLLIPSATNAIYDRYSCELLVIIAVFLVRYYQEQIQPALPFACTLLVVAVAVYGVASTHNSFSFYDARVAVASELHAAGVPDTSIDNGWEYNLDVELRYAGHINDPGIRYPSDSFVQPRPLASGTCDMARSVYFPHVRPIYGISFDPNACYGPAPFAPVHYSRWLASTPGTLYVVNYIPSSKQR